MPRLPGPVVVLTGAGISTDSGIPDFRSPGGVWDHFDPMDFTIDRFMADPAAFWEKRARLIAAMDYLDAQPNDIHRVLADAVLAGRVRRIVTQNVDGLHGKAGTPPHRVIEVHGNGRRTACIGCGGCEDVAITVRRLVPGEVPSCLACGGAMKPDVVLFGEPVLRFQEAADAVAQAGTLIAVGTSLAVHPVAGLVDLARASGARVVICNRDPTPYDVVADQVERGELAASLQCLLQ